MERLINYFENSKITTVHCLTMISIAEVIFSGTVDKSIVLWFLYGVYKILKDA